MSIYYNTRISDDAERKKALRIEQGLQDIIVETCLDIIPLTEKEREKANALVKNAKSIQDPKKREKAMEALSKYLRKQVKKIEKDQKRKFEFDEKMKYGIYSRLSKKVESSSKRLGIGIATPESSAVQDWMKKQENRIKNGDPVSIISSALARYIEIGEQEKNRAEQLKKEAEEKARAEREARLAAARRTITSMPTSTYTPQRTQTEEKRETPIIPNHNHDTDLMVKEIEEYIENHGVVYLKSSDTIKKSIVGLDKGKDIVHVDHDLEMIDRAKEIQRKTAKYDKARRLFGTKIAVGSELAEAARDVAMILPSDLLGRGVSQYSQSEQGKVLYQLRKKYFDDDLIESYTKLYDSFMQVYGKLSDTDKKRVLQDFWADVKGTKSFNHLHYDDKTIEAALASGRFISPDELKKIVNREVAESMIADKVGVVNGDEYNHYAQTVEVQRKITRATKYMEPSEITSVYHGVKGKVDSDDTWYATVINREDISDEEKRERAEAHREAHERRVEELQDNYAKVTAKKLTKEEKKEAEEKGMSLEEYVCDKYFHEKYIKGEKRKQAEQRVEQRKGKEEELTPEQKTAQRLINPKDAEERKRRVDYFRKKGPLHSIVDTLSGKKSKYQKLSNAIVSAKSEEEREIYVSEMEKMYPVSAKKVKKAVENLGLDYDTEVERAGRGK